MTPNRWQGRIFLGRDEQGVQRYHYVGRFRTRKERDDAVDEAKEKIKAEGCDCESCSVMGLKATQTLSTIGTLVTRYLAWYEKRNRGSSHDTQTQRLARFRKDSPIARWTNCRGRS